MIKRFPKKIKIYFGRIIGIFALFFFVGLFFYLFPIIPVEAATVTFNVAASEDDVGVRRDTQAFSVAPNHYPIGKVTSSYYEDTAVRFANINIPRGSAINSAYLTLTALLDSSGSTVSAIIYAENSNNADRINDINDFDGRVRTAGTSWQNFSSWVGNTPYNSIDFSSEIQTVINRGGWVSGNAINIFIFNDNSSAGAYRAYATWDHTTYTEPQLTITWTEPTAGGGDTTPPSTTIVSVEGDATSPYTDT